MTRPMQKCAIKIPVPGSEDRIVLFRWALDNTPRLRNIARVDREGAVVWRAELPGDAAHDCFVSLRRIGDVLVARTYTELVTCFDYEGSTRRPLLADPCPAAA